MAKEIINATFESNYAPYFIGATILGTFALAGYIVVKYDKIEVDWKNKELHLEKIESVRFF